jgi:DNA-binding response OmpR family regulator
MSSVLEKLQTVNESPELITLLLITAHPEDSSWLSAILDKQKWVIAFCAGCAEASEKLRSLSPPIVICERDLPDGNWKRVFSEMQKLDRTPLMLVASRHADESLWAEVLNLGGYDVLQKPFDAAEVTRVLSMAWRCWSTPHRRESPTDRAGRYPHLVH